MARSPSARKLEQTRGDRLGLQAERRGVAPYELLSACAPRGALLGPPRIS